MRHHLWLTVMLSLLWIGAAALIMQNTRLTTIDKGVLAVLLTAGAVLMWFTTVRANGGW